MRVHTRKRHTEENLNLFKVKEEDLSITAEEFIKQVFPGLPNGAVYLSGLRHKDNLTQIQLGQLIGIAQYNISKMERGLRPIGKAIAKRLAKVFNTDYRLFL